MIITGNGHRGLWWLKQFLHAQFDMIDLWILHYFLGIEVAYSPKGPFLTQQKYIHGILTPASLSDSKLVPTPLEGNAKLGITNGKPLNDPTSYCQVVGSLVYLTITHLDITFVVHTVSQFVIAPTSAHWAAVLMIYWYLRHTIMQGVMLSSNSFSLTTYSVWDWSGDINERLSIHHRLLCIPRLHPNLLEKQEWICGLSP